MTDWEPLRPTYGLRMVSVGYLVIIASPSIRIFEKSRSRSGEIGFLVEATWIFRSGPQSVIPCGDHLVVTDQQYPSVKKHATIL